MRNLLHVKTAGCTFQKQIYDSDKSLLIIILIISLISLVNMSLLNIFAIIHVTILWRTNLYMIWKISQLFFCHKGHQKLEGTFQGVGRAVWWPSGKDICLPL